MVIKCVFLAGECWSGQNGESTYFRDGPSSSCVDKCYAPCNQYRKFCSGMHFANFVYRLSKKLDFLQSAFSLIIRPFLIPASATANNDACSNFKKKKKDCLPVAGPRGPYPHVFRQNWGTKLEKNCFGDRPPLTLRSGARFSNVPVTFRARNQIFKSKYKE